jgi:amino acid permease
MPDVDLLAVAVGTVAAFILGGAYYAVFGNQLARVSAAAAAGEQPPPWTLVVEVLRCLVLVTVVAGLASQGDIDKWTGGLALGLALWIGFPLVLWTGAMLHEKVPFKLAALHGGDWLAKLLVVGVIVSVWQ